MIFIPIILAAIVAAVIAASVVRHFAIKEIDYLSYGDCKDSNDMTEQQFLNANII